MNHLNLVANELQSVGFKTEVKKASVKVSLSNRRVNNMEIRESLSQIFEDISFKLESLVDGILVVVE